MGCAHKLISISAYFSNIDFHGKFIYKFYIFRSFFYYSSWKIQFPNINHQFILQYMLRSNMLYKNNLKCQILKPEYIIRTRKDSINQAGNI